MAQHRAAGLHLSVTGAFPGGTVVHRSTSGSAGLREVHVGLAVAERVLSAVASALPLSTPDAVGGAIALLHRHLSGDLPLDELRERLGLPAAAAATTPGAAGNAAAGTVGAPAPATGCVPLGAIGHAAAAAAHVGHAPTTAPAAGTAGGPAAAALAGGKRKGPGLGAPRSLGGHSKRRAKRGADVSAQLAALDAADAESAASACGGGLAGDDEEMVGGSNAADDAEDRSSDAEEGDDDEGDESGMDDEEDGADEGDAEEDGAGGRGGRGSGSAAAGRGSAAMAAAARTLQHAAGAAAGSYGLGEEDDEEEGDDDCIFDSCGGGSSGAAGGAGQGSASASGIPNDDNRSCYAISLAQALLPLPAFLRAAVNTWSSWRDDPSRSVARLSRVQALLLLAAAGTGRNLGDLGRSATASALAARVRPRAPGKSLHDFDDVYRSFVNDCAGEAGTSKAWAPAAPLLSWAKHTSYERFVGSTHAAGCGEQPDVVRMLDGRGCCVELALGCPRLQPWAACTWAPTQRYPARQRRRGPYRRMAS